MTTMPAGAAAHPRLPLSVIVPVRDEERTIGVLLDSLAEQTRPPDEIVVVDGGSTDGTVGLLQERATREDWLTVVVAEGPATPGRGRNLGFAAARNDWVALTDAGIRVEPTWLERLWAAHVASPAARVVYGNYEFDLRSHFEQCAAVAYGEPKVTTPTGPCRGPSVVSVLLHRQAYDAVGGFVDSRAGEDEMFTRAVRDGSMPVAWAPDATVWWRLRPDLASTFERFRSYSYHYALAGEARHWQHRLARSYVPVGVGAALGAVHSRRWWGLAVATVAGRTLVRVRRHRSEGDGRWLRPSRLAAVAGITLVNDAGTFLGWIQAERELRKAQAATG